LPVVAMLVNGLKTEIWWKAPMDGSVLSFFTAE
jgi:hypothetical protein